jgi:hypothetical protein
MTEKPASKITTTGLRVPRKLLVNDLVSGLIMAIVTIPGAIANGVLAGVNPVYGLYTIMTATPIATLFTIRIIMNLGHSGLNLSERMCENPLFEPAPNLTVGYCRRSHDGARAANLEVLVVARGTSSNQAIRRSRLMAAAVATCCICVLASPRYRVCRIPNALTP